MNSPSAAHELAGLGVPDVPEAVVGWRQWTVTIRDGRPRLVSPVRLTVWEPGTALVAVCPHGHAVPADGCGCGLYAGRSVGAAAQAAIGMPSTTVIGQVALWGEVVEGELGWRATRGCPTVLVVDSTVDDATIAALAEDYRVPVHRSPVRVSFLRALPDAEQVRRVRAPGQRRQDRILEVLARHRAAADAAGPAAGMDEFLRLTGELSDQLRRASLARIPREVARILGGICLPLDLCGVVVAGVGSGPVERWSEGWQALAGLVFLTAALGVVGGFADGFGRLKAMISMRFPPARQRWVFRSVVVPLVVMALAQGMVVIALVRGEAVVSLFLAVLVLPVVVVTAVALVGWRLSFSTAGQRAPEDQPERP